MLCFPFRPMPPQLIQTDALRTDATSHHAGSLTYAPAL